jgi:hypothetical protein
VAVLTVSRSRRDAKQTPCPEARRKGAGGRTGGRLPRTPACRTRRRSGARPPTKTCARPSPAVAGCPNPVSAGWPSASESEDANGDANGGTRLPQTLAGRRRPRTATVNGNGDDKTFSLTASMSHRLTQGFHDALPVRPLPENVAAPIAFPELLQPGQGARRHPARERSFRHFQ